MGMAVMKVSRHLVEDLMAPVKSDRCIACLLTDRKDWLHGALKLPANAVINAVGYDFMRDLVMLRIECPDFKVNVENQQIPEVTAFYTENAFVRWEGEAVKPKADPQAMKDFAAKMAEAKTFGEVNDAVDAVRAHHGLPPQERDANAYGTLNGLPLRVVDNLPELKQDSIAIGRPGRNYWEAE